VTAANIVGVPGPPVLPARYALGERLGQGASGETFAVVDTTDGTACVAKLFAAGAAARGAAMNELAGLQALAHPSIVRVRDVGRTADGRMFLVTERIVGPSIDSLASIPDETARREALQRAAHDLAGALAHLHGRGIVHGDVCPANVRMAGDGRAVLIDFGLAGPPLPGDGAARGTLGYAAPEALTGVLAPVGDLFALGATLFEAWSGAPPFGRGLAAVQRVLSEAAPALSSVRPGLGEGWDRLLARLLAGDPGERPASARELLREVIRLSAGAETPAEVDLGVPYPEGDPLAGIFVGRRAERTALRATLERLADGAAPVSTLALVGAPGSGRRTLFEVVARELAVSGAAGTTPVIQFWRGDLDGLAAWLLPASTAPASDAVLTRSVQPLVDPQRAADARWAAMAEALEARAAEQPLCVWLDEGPAATAFAAWAAGAAPSGRVLLVVPLPGAPARPFAEAIALEKLTAADVESLLVGAGDAAVPAGEGAGLARSIVDAAQGNAAVVGVIARRLIANLRAGRGAATPIDAGADLDGLLAEGYRALPRPAQQLVLALALTAGADRVEAAAIARLAADGDAAAGARAAGWLESISDGAVRLPSAAHRRAAIAAAEPALRARMATWALAHLDADDPLRAEALAAAGRPGEAAAVLRRAAAQAVRADGAPTGAALLYERADMLAPDLLDGSERMALVTGLGLLGRYQDAARALEAARARAGDDAARAACAERDAWLRARRGDTEGARAAL